MIENKNNFVLTGTLKYFWPNVIISYYRIIMSNETNKKYMYFCIRVGVDCDLTSFSNL